VGSFGHGTNQNNINKAISRYNLVDAFQPTPAGQVLVNSGLFGASPQQSLANLQALGAVQQPVQPAPADEAGMGWLRAFDVSVNWIYKYKERFTVQPGVSFFNVMNFANFDGPGNPLSGALSAVVPGGPNYVPGTLNGTSGQQPSSNRLGLGSGVFALGSPRVMEFSLKFSF
jgi:hypothetical protein